MQTMIRTWTGLAEAVVGHVEAATGSREVLLAASRLPPFGPSDPARVIDVGAIAHLLDAAAGMLDDDAVGLHLAAGFELGNLGPFSYAVLHAPTVGTALRNLERYSESLAIGARPRVEIEGPAASLALPSWGGQGATCRHLSEAAVLVFLRMLRQLAGPGWRPIEVCFRHAAPADVGEHRRLLGHAVRFGRSADRIRFAAADLERSVPHADRFLLPIVERELQDVVSDRAEQDPWRHDLELVVASHVCDGHPGIRTIAPRLGVSVRTLQRRLDERGLSFRRLVADVRLQIARHYLEEPEPSLGEIAFLLGYSELSAFDRAFKKWTGTSPGEYRRQRRAARRATTTADPRWPAG